VYVSFDKGANWQLFSNGLPKVAVHDLVIQNEAKDLLIGTHGRSIYKANVAALQDFNSIKNSAVAIFKIPSVRYSSRWGSSWSQWSKPFEPSITISFYTSTSGEHTLEVLTEDDLKLNSFVINADKGFNYFDYDLSVKGKKNIFKLSKNDNSHKRAKNGIYYLPQGKYFIKIGDIKKPFEVK
jgi:hypothetical protein